MKKNLLLLALWCGLLCASFTTQAARLPNSPVLKKKIETLTAELMAAFKEANMQKVASFYDDDARIMLADGQQIEGRKAIHQYWTSMAQADDVKFEIVEVGGSSDMIYHVGKATTTHTVNGQPVTETAGFVMLWKKQPDWSYKIYVDNSH